MTKKQINGRGSCLPNVFDSGKCKKLETDLFKCEEVLRQAEQVASDAFWDWNIESGHLTWNEASDKVLEFPPVVTATSGDWWRTHIHPEDWERVVEGLHQAINGEGTLWWDEYRFLRSDGSYTRIMDRGVVLRQPSGKATRMIGTMFDLTLRQQAGQCLQEAKGSIAEIHQTKREFLDNISHELRTSITIIIASLELLSQFGPQPDQRHILNTAEISAQHLKNLINDLFNFSRMETHNVTLAKTLFDVRACVEKTLGNFSLKAQEKALRLGWDIALDIPEIVYGSPDHLSQVLLNLVENAIKFTEQGEVMVKVRSVPGREKQVLFSVQDSGIGIPVEKCNLLFQDFRQVDPSNTSKYGVIGLGLTTSKKLVELMGGVIWVESEVGQGSTFSFSLPLR
jgi:signal transduction histidine kinase